MGRGQNEAIYVHFPLFTGLLFIFGDLYLNDSGIISSKGGLLALLMSDNIHYRFPLGRHVTVSPYVNVLGLEAGVKGRIHRRCTGGGGATDDIPGTPVVCTEVTEPPVLINLAGGGVQLVSRFGGRVELDLHVAGKQVYGQWDFDIANRHYFAYDLGVSARYVFR